jgi:precorrin-6B methylase 2
MFTHHQKTVGGGNSFIFHITDNSFSNDFSHRCATFGTSAAMNVSNTGQITGFDATYASGSVAKVATAIRLNNCAFSANAGSAITDLSASLPTVDRMFIGGTHASSNHINGTIAAIRYYKKRLPNAKLQALTV